MEIGPFPDKNGPCQVPFKGQAFKGSSGIVKAGRKLVFSILYYAGNTSRK